MNKNITKILSVMLVAIMIVLMIPFAANAASDVEQITSLDQLTTGKYVIATAKTNLAMTYVDNSNSPWILTQKVTPSNGKITGVADSALWTITVVSTGSVKLTDSNGATIAPKAAKSSVNPAVGIASGIKSTGNIK